MRSSPEIEVHCRVENPRLAYVVNYLTMVTGLSFTTVAGPDMMLPIEKKAIIHYGEKPEAGAFNIFSCGLINETGIHVFEPEVARQGPHIVLFPAPDGFDLSFDLFSTIFYMLTRYEEYLPFVPDRYGRFEANQSLAFKYGFLEEPIVDQCLETFRASLKNKYAELILPERKFKYMSTIDVDNPWAYKHRGFLRTVSGMLKQLILLNFRECRNRLSVLSGKAVDPFDTYTYIREAEDRYGFRSVFFFLSGGYDRFDVNYALKTKKFRELLEETGHDRIIGIHPSFRSNKDFSLLQSEFNEFCRILGKKPECSRQHFLMLEMPDTYRNLALLGVRKDFSMGFSSVAGFRAGTSLPFRFYDLTNEQETDLIIHPFIVMDVTLQQYMGLRADEASAKINTLIQKVMQVKGTFTSLWHNESLCERGQWLGWRKVFEGMLDLILP